MSVLDRFHSYLVGPEDGRRWVFLHGLMGSANNWLKITGTLQKTERVLCFDQRGHGRTGALPGAYAPEDYAKDLKEILDELGWERILLVGHSMGARNALVFASLYPERVEKLVIEDIGPNRREQQTGFIEKLLDSVPTPFPSRSQAKSFFSQKFLEVWSERSDARTLSAFLYSNIKDLDSGEADWRFSKEAILESLKEGRTQDRWTEWEGLQMPVLVIRGSESKDLTPEIYEEMLRRQKRARGEVLGPAGHWVHYEKPEEFTRLLLEFSQEQD